MKRLYSLITVLFFTVAAGCVSEFEPKGISGSAGILVIEGIIGDYESIIQLSTSVALNDDLLDNYRVDGAEVYVERDDDVFFRTVETESSGRYRITTEKLLPDKKYRLIVRYAGEEYISEFLSPVPTPAIEDVKLTKGSPGEPVRLRVTTKGEDDGTRYYSWMVDEHWEFHTELYARHREQRYPTSTVIRLNKLHTSENTYFCWGKEYTGRIFATSSRNQENMLTDYPILDINPTDRRMQLLYYVDIVQSCVRKDTYDYFENIRKNSQLTGGLFSPVPSEVKGNIVCASSPGTPVIGYIDVSSTERLEKFFPDVSDFYEPENENCQAQVVTTTSPLIREGYGLYEFTRIGDPNESLWIIEKDNNSGGPSLDIFKYAPSRCVDCTTWPNATKLKPDWWPSDNL